MPCIHNNKINHIDEFNLLHDILNPNKLKKQLNIHYSPILHGWMNTRKVKAKCKNFRILLGSGCSYTIVIGGIVENWS